MNPKQQPESQSALDSALVYLVDDDEAIRDSLGLLFRSVGLNCEVYASALEFLEAYDPRRHSCLVADIRMPGLSGLELQQRLNERRADVPVIFITGHGDVPMAVNAMKSGAADFIQKPFRDQDLIDRIHKALAQDRERRVWRAEERAIRERIALLTPREAEVMRRVVRGQANKVIAMDLGVSQRTVELHRARVMRKLKMRSLAELVSAVGKVLELEEASGTAAAR
ncbi:MAG TPA: response regulator transcription factor [Gammaproteobacteria bacterium]|nr:response regulator transcription factor [Gammaproteobacteria bacterium]